VGKLDHAIIAAAVLQCRCHLSACVKASGGHFEQWSWLRHCFYSDNCDLFAAVDQSNSCTPICWFGL